VTITGQQEYGIVDWLNGVNPSAHKPSLTFRGSEANSGYN